MQENSQTHRKRKAQTDQPTEKASAGAGDGWQVDMGGAGVSLAAQSWPLWLLSTQGLDPPHTGRHGPALLGLGETLPRN